MKNQAAPERFSRKMLTVFHLLENQFQVKLTLHDHIGSFSLHDGTKLLPKTNIHTFDCCQFWQNSRFRCHIYCSFGAKSNAAEAGKAYVSCCFCGVTEVVMPLYYGKVHAATIFAGAFRQKDFDLSAFPLRYRKIYEKLPLWEDSRLEQLEPLLESAGYSLMMMAENLRRSSDSDEGRPGQIRQFFRNRYAENVGVADLAAELGLSESRTIHVLLEHFGKGFSHLLTRERLRNADRLLAESDLPLRKIAQMTGFSNEYYMSNVFRKIFSISPGARRKQNSIFRKEENL